MNTRLAAAAATAAALSLALTACSNSDDATDASAAGAGSAVTVSHIHGLGLDPSDQRLYVATHEGVYTPDAQGRPTLVGGNRDDFMGFTVAGSKTFFASGHPSAGSDGPGNKGLIKSTDAGRSWKSLSLSGESDFHALDYVHDTVYGYDSTSGRLRTSKDGITWKDAAALEALDIAVSPRDPGLVLATTADGVARSTDGGRTFAAGGDPVMAFLSWPAEEALYGIDTAAWLHRSADGGTTWKRLTTVPGGQPQALTAVGAEHVLAATQTGVYESKDGGRSFAKRLDVESSGGH
ncbi:exo-alpha-sialidase [Streptomyces sp. F001]|uniref:F510_1955 family glycosylhydrolase n=1 Tax=Streptomyces sp. F001 TaxID=1510026 RepID=UPI00101E3B3D|nr:exo-alpha-sialidase [Streptomyces sp. F001]RZB14303.1 exo-alpha-sialidase [Streptomyces sp. F001]